ncbi:hypothetical protein F5884DRAFT_853342 [Xylogone sp. PMI_703]|nr:hypothetical protein F5884DRAFT_853342 [Xylogone sp. PMI_703]
MDLQGLFNPTFPSFSLLPPELRLKIWLSAMPPPRIVPVQFCRPLDVYASPIANPALLAVCSESRALCLQRYSKLLLNPKYDSHIYVDFDRDTIFFDSLECSPEGDLSFDLAMSGPGGASERILKCAIDTQLWEVLRVFRTQSLSEIRLLQNLRTFALVLKTELGDRDLEEHYRHSIIRRGRDGAWAPLVVDKSMEDKYVLDGYEAGLHVCCYVHELRRQIELEGSKWKEFWHKTPPDVQMWVL